MRNNIINICTVTFIYVFIMIMILSVYKMSFNSIRESDIRYIYNRLWVQTGQVQDKIPLRIVKSPLVNAYNNGKEIVIYTGLIETLKTLDELALVLGHEIAHTTLGHLKITAETNYDISVLEGNADKLGALYMMKAGYDVCKGRLWFHTMLNMNGDYLGGDHPNYSYRYSELNIGCN